MPLQGRDSSSHMCQLYSQTEDPGRDHSLLMMAGASTPVIIRVGPTHLADYHCTVGHAFHFHLEHIGTHGAGSSV